MISLLYSFRFLYTELPEAAESLKSETTGSLPDLPASATPDPHPSPDKQRADRNYEQHRRQYDCRYIFFDTTTSISFYLLLLVLANICVKKYVFSTDKKTIHNSLTFRNTLLFSMYMLFCIPIGKPVCRIDQCPDLHAFF